MYKTIVLRSLSDLIKNYFVNSYGNIYNTVHASNGFYKKDNNRFYEDDECVNNNMFELFDGKTERTVNELTGELTGTEWIVQEWMTINADDNLNKLKILDEAIVEYSISVKSEGVWNEYISNKHPEIKDGFVYIYVDTGFVMIAKDTVTKIKVDKVEE